MANGTFDYKNDPRFAKLRHGAKYGMYDQAALTSALNAPDLKGSAGYDFGQAFSEIGDTYNPQGNWQDYTSGLLGAMQSDPNARDPGFGGMSYSQFQSLFPDQAKAFGRSQEFKDFQSGVGQPPPPGNPVQVVPPGEDQNNGQIEDDLPIPGASVHSPPPPPSSPPPVDPGMRDYYNQKMEAARALARSGRTDFDLSEAAEAARRMGMPSDIESLRGNIMKSFVAPAGATTGPAAQPQVDVNREQMGVVSQAAGPSAAAAQAVGGITDKELRQQQMDTQRELIQGAEDFAARTRQGLPGVRVADPNLNIRLEEAAAPTGGPSIGVRGLGRPELLATGDVQYDPEYFKYETDLQQVMLDSLRQNLLGPGGMDPVAASQMADARARQAKDEAQTVEDLQRYGVLRGGGDTADVLGELRSGYGRTYSDILADQALRRQDDPSLEAAMQLAQLGSDRYMRGGEMIGRLGGQDTLAARQAQQDALERQSAMDLEAQIEQQRATEREADISGFLRGARSLAGRDQDIGAQMDRADRQLEQARVLAPQYQYAADLQRRDAMMQQDLADRALARGMTITEPTTRERFEEGVRGAQEAEALARAGVSGYLDGQSTLARETALDLERERIEQEEKRLELELQGERDIQADRLAQTERQSQRDYAVQKDELINRLTLANIDLDKATRIQNLINEGQLDVAAEELASAERMQTERVGQEEKQSQRDYALSKDELQNRLTMANIDLDKATRIQNLINSGNLALAEKELEGVTATLTSEEKRQTERVAASSADLAAQLENNIAMGNIDKNKATEIQGLINSGNLELAKEELASAEAMQAERIGQEEKQSQRDYAVQLDELKNRLAIANIDLSKAYQVQELINSGNLALAKEELDSAERMQTERVTASSADLAAQLENNIAMGNIDKNKAIEIQNLINSGNLELAKEELESAEAMQAERIGQEEKQSQRDYAVQLDELKNRLAIANIDLSKAYQVQELINSGNLALAKEELDSAERMQTERVTASSADLAAQLENNIAMGNIDKNKAIEIQNLINSGNLDLAKEELESAERMQTERVTSEEGMQTERLASDEAMQTERIQSQEGQFNSELEFRKAMETGQIDGMPTLQSIMQRAQLADMLTARQAESLGQMLALANAMPDEQRSKVMAAFAKPLQDVMAGRGYTDTKLAMLNILNIDPQAYAQEGLPTPGGQRTTRTQNGGNGGGGTSGEQPTQQGQQAK